MTIDMQKLDKAHYDEIEAYCQRLAWRGLANQGQPNTYPSNLSDAVRDIISMAAAWALAKEKKRRK